jgi:Arc/MetJ-type ribon-helix-helix transcriptional regulator
MAEAERAEKVTINLGLVDLGRIDLLVAEGFFSNRTDFIRSAIRNQLSASSDAIDKTVIRRTLALGTEHYSRARLEGLRAAGKQEHIRVLGLASIAADVPPELAVDTIASVEVLGAFRASPEVKAALRSRIV